MIWSDTSVDNITIGFDEPLSILYWNGKDWIPVREEPDPIIIEVSL